MISVLEYRIRTFTVTFTIGTVIPFNYIEYNIESV